MSEKKAYQEAEEWCNKKWNNVNLIWRERILLDAARHDALAAEVAKLCNCHNTLVERFEGFEQVQHSHEVAINDILRRVAKLESACGDAGDEDRKSPADSKDTPPAEPTPEWPKWVRLINVISSDYDIYLRYDSPNSLPVGYRQSGKPVGPGYLGEHTNQPYRKWTCHNDYFRDLPCGEPEAVRLWREEHESPACGGAGKNSVHSPALPPRRKTLRRQTTLQDEIDYWRKKAGDLESQLDEYKQDVETLRKIVSNKMLIMPHLSALDSSGVIVAYYDDANPIHEAVQAAMENE